MRDLRFQVYERAQGHCDVTGRMLPGGPEGQWEMHHRRPKGMGGTSLPHKDCTCNLIAVLSHVHNMDPASIHGWPTRARDHGWLLRKHIEDPGLCPIWWRNERWVMLLHDGTLESLPAWFDLGVPEGWTDQRV